MRNICVIFFFLGGRGVEPAVLEETLSHGYLFLAYVGHLFGGVETFEQFW